VGGIRDMQVDVRVIAASNRDLERAVRDGTFRQDLYYRLAIISIFLPPLRERREDILPMVEFFIERYGRKFRKNVRGITEETRKLLMTHNWPGNVRELKNAIERAMILEEEEFLRPTYMPFAVGQGQTGLTAFERVSGAPVDGGAQPLEGGRSLPPLNIPEGGTSLEEVERREQHRRNEKYQDPGELSAQADDSQCQEEQREQLLQELRKNGRHRDLDTLDVVDQSRKQCASSVFMKEGH
jgi:DNA-binding NtrC family response regulator